MTLIPWHITAQPGIARWRTIPSGPGRPGLMASPGRGLATGQSCSSATGLTPPTRAVLPADQALRRLVKAARTTPRPVTGLPGTSAEHRRAKHCAHSQDAASPMGDVTCARMADLSAPPLLMLSPEARPIRSALSTRERSAGWPGYAQ